MNKKILFIFLLFIIKLAHSDPNDQMKIRVTALESADCKLVDYTILGGHVSDRTKIPQTIYRNQTGAFSMRPTGKHLAQIILNYACGDNMSISLLTEQTPASQYPGGGYYSRGSVLKAKGMQAKVKIASGKTVRSDRVYWTFKEGCFCCNN